VTGSYIRIAGSAKVYGDAILLYEKDCFKKGELVMNRLSRRSKFLMALFVLIVFAGCAAGPRSQSTGEYIDDSVITSKVKALLIKDEALKAFQISVETYNGVVLLSGFVDSRKTIDLAGEIAQSVAGVKSVKNHLILKQR
jgi:hypothetical protein